MGSEPDFFTHHSKGGGLFRKWKLKTIHPDGRIECEPRHPTPEQRAEMAAKNFRNAMFETLQKLKEGTRPETAPANARPEVAATL